MTAAVLSLCLVGIRVSSTSKHMGKSLKRPEDKKRAAVQPKPTATKTARRKKADDIHASNVDRHYAAASAETSVPQSQSSSLELQVVRAMYDNFPGWTAVQLYSMTFGDPPTTVYGKLLQDKATEAADSGCIVFGATYYRKLREAAAGECSSLRVLRAKNPTEPIDDQLWKAIRALRSANSCKGPLVQWLSTSSAEPVQREVVALLKTALVVNPRASAKQRSIIMDILRYCQRWSIATKFAEEWQQVSSHFDLTCCCAFSAYTRMKMTPSAWFADYKALLKSVLPDAAGFAQLMKLSSDLSTEKTLLRAVCHGSQIGHRVFSFALTLIIAETVNETISHCMDEMIEESKSCEILVTKWINRALTACTALPGIDNLPHRRAITVTYSGRSVTGIKVESVLEQVKLNVMALVVHHQVAA